MAYMVTFDTGDSAYLEHFGKKGMKWGVWNAETAARYRGGDSSVRGSHKTVRQLNNLDKRWAVEVGKANTKLHKYEAINDTKNRALAKGREKKAKTLEESANKYKKSYEAHRDAAVGITQHQRKLMQNAIADGYKIKMRNCPRSTLTKGEKALQFAGAVAMGAATGYYATYDNYVSGVKYKLAKERA